MSTAPLVNHKGTIVVIDDTPANLRLLTDMLNRQGYKVRPVASGEMGLKTISASLPDLILLDINMPDMNGYEVCHRLKRNEATREIPVMFISAMDEAWDKVRAFQVGGVDYITKPFQLEEVVARINSHIDLKRLRDVLDQRITQKNEIFHLLEMTVKQPLAQLLHGISETTDKDAAEQNPDLLEGLTHIQTQLERILTQN